MGRTTLARRLLSVVCALGALVAPATVAAQGKSGQTPAASHGKKPGQLGGGPTTTTASTPTPATISLATWLDDASLLTPGAVWVSASAARWKTDAGTVIEAPILNVAAGLSPRVNLGAGVPFYRFTDTAGATESGIADVMLFGKIGLRSPESHVGVALTPVIDIAGQATTDGSSRVTWALPVSLERRSGDSRAYGSAGYWSNGAIFGTGALEFTVAPTVSLTGSLGYSYATRAASVPAGQNRYRTDLSGTVAVTPRPSFSVFGAVGHAFSGTPSIDGGLWIAAGASFRVKGR